MDFNIPWSSYGTKTAPQHTSADFRGMLEAWKRWNQLPQEFDGSQQPPTVRSEIVLK
jgi:hypothetical protein